MDQEICPMCRTSAGVVKSYALRLTLSQWPAIILFAGVVLLSGDFLNVTGKAVYWFVAIAIFPLLFELVKKRTCMECGIEFGANLGGQPE